MENTIKAKYIPEFWAKTTKDGAPGISVFHHMKNVGAVALELAKQSQLWVSTFELEKTTIATLAGLHDIGKITIGFQLKCQKWIEKYPELNLGHSSLDNFKKHHKNHSKTGQDILNQFLVEKGIPPNSAKYIALAIAAHHGKIAKKPTEATKTTFPFDEVYSGIKWPKLRKQNADKVWHLFHPNTEIISKLNKENPALWWIAGLTTIADWIGSNEDYFSSSPDQSNINAIKNAQFSIQNIGLNTITINRNLDFHDLFYDEKAPSKKWIANDIQKKANEIITQPGTYIIEAPMGLGKTEAALWAAYTLMCENKASGIYFALPTQATSNRIFLRFKNFIERITTSYSPPQLIHSNSWLMDDALKIPNTHQENTDSKNWFTSSKRAILAPFGVGTIDQALLGVVPVKHFFVRHFALAGKVVILDEVHSYDIYTGTLINTLIKTLEKLGCTIIILSATLSKNKRHSLIKIPEEFQHLEIHYPLITGRNHTGTILPATPKLNTPEKQVKIRFQDTDKTIQEAIDKADNGARVLWIANTVHAAQEIYTQLKAQNPKVEIGLLHSRFPFFQRELLEEKWMGIFGKNRKDNEGAILISTQICEQSVDLDADLLISELAPSDMLLQRIGRLWRHDRAIRACDIPELILLEEKATILELKAMEAKNIKSCLGKKAFIYAPYILLRTLAVWKTKTTINIPNDIRAIIEATYKEVSHEPEAWQELNIDWIGGEEAKKQMATWAVNLWDATTTDQERLATRLNEIETVPLVLLKSIRRLENENNHCLHIVFLSRTELILNQNTFQIEIKKELHKNQIHVPRNYFQKKLEFPKYIEPYGHYLVGKVEAAGEIPLKTLKENKKCFYTHERGLWIEDS